MNLTKMLVGPLVVAVAVTAVSMLFAANMTQWFGQFAVGGTAFVAVLILDLLKVKY